MKEKAMTPEEEKANNRFSFIVGIGIGVAIMVLLVVLSLVFH